MEKDGRTRPKRSGLRLLRWLRRTLTRVAAREPTEDLADPLFVSRPRIEQEIADAVTHGENLVIYGPARQGKTTLLSRQLRDADSIYIECRPDFKRSQIYRVALASLGYAMLVEKKRRGKATTTVKLGLVEASGEGELEQVMQSVTVDLKNPSEVAHLISRLNRVPRIVLNNFQLLDRGTRENLLFDLVFFAERSRIRFVIVGAWSNEEYLEEIEPALAGKLRYVYVPTWSDQELCDAFSRWSSRRQKLSTVGTQLDELLTLAGGDISLFRALAEGSVHGAAVSHTAQSLVVGRFRRGLTTKLRALLAERDAYIAYLWLQSKSEFRLNPKYQPIDGAMDSDYSRTDIDPRTQRPYSDGREVRLDARGNPQYLERVIGEIVQMDVSIAPFLLQRFHGAVRRGINRLELSELTREFAASLDPKPIALNEPRLKRVLAGFGEVQRQALIVPPMLANAADGAAIELVDRRLLLFLQSVSAEELGELVEEATPRVLPDPRRRNHVSDELTETERAAYVSQIAPSEPENFGADDGAEADMNNDEFEMDEHPAGP